jgi:hypothetical protein
VVLRNLLEIVLKYLEICKDLLLPDPCALIIFYVIPIAFFITVYASKVDVVSFNNAKIIYLIPQSNSSSFSVTFLHSHLSYTPVVLRIKHTNQNRIVMLFRFRFNNALYQLKDEKILK